MDLQDSGSFSPIEAVFLQFRRRTVKGDVWRDVTAAASESAGAGRRSRRLNLQALRATAGVEGVGDRLEKNMSGANIPFRFVLSTPTVA